MREHDHGPKSKSAQGPLAKALLVTAASLVVEVIGGFWTGSLALLADASHMLSDAAALGLALFASWMAARPPTLAKTYGYRRTEVLAAFVNGALLLCISVLIAREALARWRDPPAVRSVGMIVVALIGLLANLLAFALLREEGRSNINTRAAMWHVLTDALGSLGALIAGLCLALADWRLADPIASLSISLLVLWSGLGLARETVNILMEGTPRHLDLRRIQTEILNVAGVREVHDLHVWTITSGFDALTCHLRVDQPERGPEFLHLLQERLRSEFGINHTTIQIEPVEMLAIPITRASPS
jgi:cobalt-zinc-cadmium efflux system protein